MRDPADQRPNAAKDGPGREPIRRSLRGRLVWAFFLLTTFVLTVLIGALFFLGEAQESDLIDEVINSALDSAVRDGAPAVAGSLGPNLTLYRAPAGVAPPGMPAPVTALPVGLHEWVTGDTEYHIGIREHGGERLYLFYDETGYARRMEWLYMSLAVGAVLLSLLSLSLGYGIARSLLRQFGPLADGLDRGEAPFTRPDQDREVAQLAQALDSYHARNVALIEREREFTANVSHELRTPLTRIRTSAELLADGVPDNDGSRARRILAAVDELESRLKVLLFLARGNAQAQSADIELRPGIERLLEPYREGCAARGVTLENRIPAGTAVRADPALLDMLFDNVLRNAVAFTQAGSITASFEDGWLTLRDTGAGIPPDQQALVFERHFRADALPADSSRGKEGGGEGSGLGLAIVRDIATRCGWQCALESTPGRGTTFRVRLQG